MKIESKIFREIPPISEDDFFIVLNHSSAKFDFPVHTHSELELNMVINSSGKRIIGDSVQEYEDFDLVLVGPNVPHAWTGNKKNKNAQVVTIQFHENFLSGTALSRKLMLTIKELLEKAKRGVTFTQETFELIKPKILRLSESEDFDSLLRFLSILYDLSVARKTKMLASTSFANNYTISKSRRIDKVNTFIKENIAQKIYLKQVSDLVNMSESAFSHFFKKSTNTSFTDYVTDLRLGMASRMFMETEKSISEVCFECGFNNISNFNRSYKKKTGYTPTQFRELQRLITKH